MKIHLFVSGDRGIKVFETLVKEGYKIEKVYFPKDNLYFKKNSTISIPNELLTYVNKEKLNKLFKKHKLKPDLFVVAGFPLILTKDIFDFPKYGTINLHAGAVPKYRGGSPLNWQMIEGEKKAGISILKMNSGLDTGPILERAFINIKKNTTIKDLHEEANTLFPKLLLKVIKNIVSNNIKLKRQNNKLAIYWHQRSDKDGKIDFRIMGSKKIDLFVRALTKPYPGAWTEHKGKRLRIFRVKALDRVIKGTVGRICWIEGLGPLVICNDKAICLVNYSYDNGRIPLLKNNDFLK